MVSPLGVAEPYISKLNLTIELFVFNLLGGSLFRTKSINLRTLLYDFEHFSGSFSSLVLILHMIEGLNIGKNSKHERELGDKHALLCQVLVVLEVVDEYSLSQVDKSEGKVLHEICKPKLDSLAIGLFNLFLTP